MYCCKKRLAAILVLALFMLCTLACSVGYDSNQASDTAVDDTVTDVSTSAINEMKADHPASDAVADDTLTDASTSTINDMIADHSALECFKSGEPCGKGHRLKYDFSADDHAYSVVVVTGEDHILVDYKPRLSAPIISKSDVPFAFELYRYSLRLPEGQQYATCSTCDKQMDYIGNVWYEIDYCGHGIFSDGNYCVDEDVYTPTKFYTRCGCYLNEK